jgi:hypothetical protein
MMTRRILLACTCMLMLPLPAGHAQVTVTAAKTDYPGLDIQAEFGWDGCIDARTPTPISFLISNNSQDVLEGTLVLREPNTFRTLVLQNLTVGPGSIRQFGSIIHLTDWEQCEASWEGPRGILWTRPLSLIGLRQYAPDKAALLYVEEGGRSLKFPTPTGVPVSAGTLPGDFVPASGIGQQVTPISIPPWQLPVHPGPLTVLRGLVLADTLKPESLNDAQWNALARWLCMGGLVFVSQNSERLSDRLLEACPLRADGPPTDSPRLLVGAGCLYRLPGPQGTADEQQLQHVAEIVSLEPGRVLPEICRSLEQEDWSAPASEVTLVRVMSVLLIYAALSSLTLLMFRSTRRWILIWTTGVVALACLGAIAAGISVRMSRGDMVWAVIAEPGAGGIVETAVLKLNSAGGSNFRTALTGRMPDLQINHAEPDRRFNYYYNPNSGEAMLRTWPAFSLTPNLTPDKSGLCTVSVPISPWGERHLRAVDFRSLQSPLQLQLDYQPEKDAGPLQGQWKVQVSGDSRWRPETLTLKMEIRHLRREDNGATVLDQLSSSMDIRVQSQPDAAEWTAVLPETTVSWMPQQIDMWIRTGGQAELAPGMALLWLEGSLAHAPQLQVDQTSTEFEAVAAGKHGFVYQVPQSLIPATWLNLLRAAP